MVIGIITFIVIILLVILLYRCAKRNCSEKNQKRLKYVRKLVFFNPIIRYYLLNCVKLNILAMIVMAGLQESPYELLAAFPLLIMVNIVPLFLFRCMNIDRTKLHKKSKKKKFGTLYNGLKIKMNPDDKTGKTSIISKVVLYNPLFFVYRRFLFAFYTVFLFEWPNLQFITHYIVSLAYIIYLMQDNLFSSRQRKYVEIASEVLGLYASALLQ